jgi:hypothetical protein
MIPPVILLVLVPFCIESPRWLISKGRFVSHCAFNLPLLLTPSLERSTA